MGKKEAIQLINEMVRKIGSKYRPERIILYGSYAWGKPTRHSDVDLLIVKNTKKDKVKRGAEVKRIVREENRFISISPLVYTPAELGRRLAMGDDFFVDIMQKGRILYG